MYGRHIGQVEQRVGPLLLVVRDAAASNPDAADVWRTLQRGRLTGMRMFAKHLEQGGHLRPGALLAD